MNLSGKRIVVTGGTGVLGPAVVVELLARGAWVTVPYRDQAKADALLSRCADEVCEPHLVHCDVTDPAQVASFAAQLAGSPVDGLACLAGGWLGGHPLWETDLSVLDDMIRRNLITTFLAINAFVPGMIAAGRGRIVTVGARHVRQNRKGSVAYAAAKSAVMTMTEGLAEELQGTGVSAYAIMPWVIGDEGSSAKATPPERIARLVSWLLDDESGVANGAVIPAYGK